MKIEKKKLCHKSVCPGQRTAVVLVRAVLAVWLTIAVRVQLADALPAIATEGELGASLQHHRWRQDSFRAGNS